MARRAAAARDVAATFAKNDAAVVAIRPERCTLSATPAAGPDMLSIAGRVAQQVYLGSTVEVHLSTDVGPCAVVAAGDGRPTSYTTGSEWFVTARTSD